MAIACETSRGIERRNRDLYVSDRVPSLWYCLWRESYHFVYIDPLLCGRRGETTSLIEGGGRPPGKPGTKRAMMRHHHVATARSPEDNRFV